MRSTNLQTDTIDVGPKLTFTTTAKWSQLTTLNWLILIKIV